MIRALCNRRSNCVCYAELAEVVVRAYGVYRAALCQDKRIVRAGCNGLNRFARGYCHFHSAEYSVTCRVENIKTPSVNLACL